MRKARLLCLIDKYEEELISSTGKLKKRIYRSDWQSDSYVRY